MHDRNTPGAYPRDLIGYGAHPPQAAWPGGARLAVQIVMNYEEGSEYSIPDGDETSEMYLTEVPGATVGPGKRDLIVESVYEYGSRSGFWRLMRMFAERGMLVTVFGAALALERNPEAARAIVAAGHEVCSHGWRWIGFQNMPIEEERAQMARAGSWSRKGASFTIRMRTTTTYRIGCASKVSRIWLFRIRSMRTT